MNYARQQAHPIPPPQIVDYNPQFNANNFDNYYLQQPQLGNSQFEPNFGQRRQIQ